MQKLLIVLAVATTAVAGCGGSGSSGASSKPPGYGAAPATKPTTTAAPSTTTAQSPDALQAEATSEAAGDIPDNQVFLTFRDAAAGYSMKYPEGWAQQGRGKQVTFRDKNNIVRVVVQSAPAPTTASVRRDLAATKSVHIESGPDTVTISGAPAVKVVYSTESAPNSVTGKRVTLVVDRYYLSQAGRVAILDLGTPRGVDNVDAYRLMSESFRWG